MLPKARVATPLPARSLVYWLYRYRRTWRSGLVSGGLTPVLYLAAMGLGLGSLVRTAHGPVAGVSYLVFIAPGLLAATAMQTAATESMYPVMGAIKWERTYHAMLATPLRVIDVLVGHLTWIGVRLSLVSGLFLSAMAGFGAVHSWWAVASLPAAVLTGLAFAAPLAAFSATQDRDLGFSLIFRFAVIPMFLFSGTFFPVTQLPGPLQPVAYATPLWHGVDLCRRLALGRLDAPLMLANAGYLLVLVVAGAAVARIAYRRRLEP